MEAVKYINKKKTCELLCISQITLWRRMKNDDLFKSIVKPVSINGRVYFKENEIALYQQKVEAVCA